MGSFTLEGIGDIEIAGDEPTSDEARRILDAIKGLAKPPEPETVLQLGGKEAGLAPFLVRTPEGQLQFPIARQPPEQRNPVGRAVLKGVRDLIAGVTTFPLDVFGADELAERIRQNIPTVETESLGEEIGAVVIQFGVPGIGAAKLAQKLLKTVKLAEKSGAVAALSRFGINVTAASGADILAADPDDVQTLGNMFPEIIPTGIDPDDPAILKRLKLGAEAGTITAGAIAVLSGTLLTFKAIFKVIRPFVQSEKVAEEVAATAVRELAIDPEAAIRSIDEVIKKSAGTPFEGLPTTGTASRDPGLIGLERSLATGAETSPALTARKAAQQTVISEQVAGVTRRAEGEGAAAGRFFEEAQTEARMVRTQAIEATQTEIATARTEIDNLADQINEFRGMETGASLKIDEAVMGELERLTLEKTRLFKAIDPGRTVVIDPTDALGGNLSLRETIKTITTKTGPLDSTPGKLPAMVGKLKKATAPPKKRKPGEKREKPKKPLTFADLEDARPDLSAAIAQARAAKEGGVVERLLELRQAMDREAVKLAESGSQAAAAAAEALDFFKNTFAPRFRQGVGNTIAKAVRRGEPVAPSAVADKFVRKGAGSLEAGEDLTRILEGIADPTQAREAVRTFAVGKLAAAVDVSGKFRPDRINTFLATHKAALTSFPGIRKEIEALSGRGIKATKKLSQLEADLVQVQKTAAITEREANRSVTALFIGRDPEKAMGLVMASDQPEAAMKILLREASKDTTGQAKRGLRVALDDWVDNKVRSRSVDLAGDDFIIVANQVEDLFKNPRTAKAMAVLYNKGEIEVLQAVRDELRLMGRINTQVTVGSPTAALQQNVQRVRIVLASLYGIVRGRGIFAISQWVMKALGKDPAANARAVLLDATLDPTLARMMLANDPGGGVLSRTARETRDVLAKRLKTYVANNIAAEIAAPSERPQRGVPVSKRGLPNIALPASPPRGPGTLINPALVGP